MKVLFSTNLPSPYRVDFFNELGKSCDLTVVYERSSSSERDSKWKGTDAVNFKEVYLNLRNTGIDQTKGSALKEYIKNHESDLLFFTNYSSPATRDAIIWCRLHGRQYYMEYDGGFNKRESFHKRLFKKILLKGASGHFTTADEHIRYLGSLGIGNDIIFKYPFSSLTYSDLNEAKEYLAMDRNKLRERLSVKEEKMIITVGRFSYQMGYGKGYDVLMNIAEKIENNIGIYIIGDEPTDEFIKWKDEKNLTNVHFVGFKTKKELAEYYAAADLFILLTRGDVWGLVVNEAMSFGLPIITSDKCISGLELIKNDENGYVVNLNNQSEILNAIYKILKDPQKTLAMKEKNLDLIRLYTIEEMSKRHLHVFKQLLNKPFK